MSQRDSPYRKPAPAPVPSTRGRAVASRPETPEERETREKRELAEARKERFRAETEIAREELADAKRTFGTSMRLVGAALLALALFGIGMHAHDLAQGATTLWVGRLGPVGLLVGPFLLVAGAGGAASKDSTPTWWRAGVIVAFLVAIWLGTDFEIELAVLVAGLM